MSASLIVRTHGHPDLAYPPTKCCCCCCDVSERSSVGALPSCPPCLYKKRVGNAYVCFSARDKKHDGLETIYCMVPMCWPMLIFTYTLISAISLPILWFTSYTVHPLWMSVEVASTVVLYSALALTSFRDFGVFPRYTERPRADQVPASVSSVDPVRRRCVALNLSCWRRGTLECVVSESGESE